MDRPSPQFTRPAPDKNRASLALGVAILHVLLGYFLIFGLGVRLPEKLQDAVTVINLRPPEPRAEAPKAAKPQGESAPANRRARPTPVVAPPPVIPVPAPPILAAPVAGPENAPTSGAAPLPGPGTGAGGEGAGSGGYGDGDGGGGTPARWRAGRITPDDYPDRALDDGIEGITGVRLTISERGRVTSCAVTRSSGSRDLDATTCRLIQKRFRYEPARDAWGRPVEGEEDGAQEWTVERRGRDDDDR